MKVAWSELTYQPKKYLLVEGLIVVMMFMVVFLTGLANGLGRDVSAQIEQFGDRHYLLSDDSKGLITFSNITAQQSTQLKQQYGSEGAELVIQRAAIQAKGTSEKQDATYFAIAPEEDLNPAVHAGHRLGQTKGQAVLDESFYDKGLRLGDRLKDTTTNQWLEIVGFVKDAKYGHSPVIFISKATYTQLRQKTMPPYEWQPQAYSLPKASKLTTVPKGLETYSKAQIIQKIPGYQAEALTLSMIIWVLVLASSAILGVFFYILTLQKLKQFGVLKAIGFSMAQIAGMQLAQIFLLALAGLGLGTALAVGLAQVLPKAMPFFLTWTRVGLLACAFLVIALLCGSLSLFKVRQVDPVQVIGGNGE
ncbi:ABC transporter permease [Streptococcus halichoeri]|uniref:ABC transporter permease n=1 Tax=Streptococcus halichoeri TaxID=254785 RepID=UPI00135C08DD|nr:ABC transporter permease [Streptococcus halichoeri]